MSTGLECLFVEHARGWFYVLQDWNCPAGAWDWKEYATCYGPFRSEDAANDHLHKHHANPGGYGVISFKEGSEPEGVLATLIKKARR